MKPFALAAVVSFLAGCAAATIQPPTASSPILQVANKTSNTVTFYTLGAGGDSAPTVVIGGPSTQLNAPVRAWPIQGQILYVLNRGNNTITAYPIGKAGDTAPVAVIGGSATGLNDPSCIQLDSKSNIWVSNAGNDTIVEFAAGANGNVAPILQISGSQTQLHAPESLHIAFRSNEIFVSNRGSNSLVVFAAGSSGNAVPERAILGGNSGLIDVGELELDSVGNIWVANGSAGNILKFGPSATGNVPPDATITLAGGTFRPYGLAVDASDNLVASDTTSDAVYYFAAHSNGVTTPFALLRGPATALHGPVQLGIPQPIATPIP